MLITEDDVKHLKPWLIKKLEAISEADSQILSDYVLALFQADSSEPELRSNAIENLADFLGEDTRKFVDDVFQVIRTKAYIPGYAAVDTRFELQDRTSQDPFTRPSLTSQQDVDSRNSSASRKRNHNDSNRAYIDYDSPNPRQYDRTLKKPRRGHNFRSDADAHNSRPGAHPQGRGDRPQAFPQHAAPIPVQSAGDTRPNFQRPYPLPSSVPRHTHPLPVPPPPFHPPANGSIPFDPNAAIQAVMTLQAMGFPIPLPGTTESGKPPKQRRKSQKRCHDYDSKGYCHRGESCIYQHETKHRMAEENGQAGSPRRAGSTDKHRPHSNSNGTTGTGTGSRPANTNRAPFSATKLHGNRELFHGIVVENIPEEYFSRDKVEQFFSQFGGIQRISMRAYHHLAIVVFNDHLSAQTAVESPKVIFDNRFVKVFWYIPALDEKAQNDNAEPESDYIAPEEPPFDKEQFEKDNEAAQQKHLARKALLEETEQKRIELARMQQEIETKKAEAIEKMRSMLAAKGKSLPPEIEQAATETAKSEETETLLAQLKALEDEAKSLGIDAEPWLGGNRGSPYRGRGSYRGWRGYSTRGRGRGGFNRAGMIGGGVYNLDNRPRTVKVEGIEFDDSKDESLKRYLFTLGEFVSFESDEERKTHTITFKDRLSAEAFFYGPRDIPEVGKLMFSWIASPASPMVRQTEDIEMKDASGEQAAFAKPVKVADRNEELPLGPDVQREDEVNDSGEDYEWIT